MNSYMNINRLLISDACSRSTLEHGCSVDAPIWVNPRDSRLVFCRALRYQMVMSKTPIEELAKKLADSVPDGMRTMRSDLEDGFRTVLQSGLNKLDLVSREDFEVQEAVLQRTREKLEALEKRLEELEK